MKCEAPVRRYFRPVPRSILPVKRSALRLPGITLRAAPGTEECLLFPTGFAANLGAISALAGGAGDAAIFSDELNHASIVDGCRLAVRASATLQARRPAQLSVCGRGPGSLGLSVSV